MKLLFFLSYLFLNVSSNLFASSLIYQFGDLMVSFEQVDGFVINSSCDDKKCEAFSKAKDHERDQVPSKLLDGGKNPDSVKCKTLLKGEVVFGTDMEGHEQSFCLFKDGSYLL
jgi:hypothetical protein